MIRQQLFGMLKIKYFTKLVNYSIIKVTIKYNGVLCYATKI